MAINFGRDISCTESLKTGRYSRGVRLVAEAAYRRLTTPRGMLRGGEEEANYGIDLTDLIGSISTKADAAALGGKISAELTKDERIISAKATVIPTTEGAATRFDIVIDVQTTQGPFDLQLSVDEVTVELLGIGVQS